MNRTALGVLFAVLSPGAVGAQDLPPADTLRLPDLQIRALQADPRLAQDALQRRASALRTANLGVDRLPRLLLRGDASYQSETAAIPIPNAGFDPPPKERYEAALETDWTVWDGGLVEAQEEAEASLLDSSLASLEAELYDLRMQVSDAFFSARLLQEQVAETDVLIGDLESRLNELRERVAVGFALPGDTAMLRAEVLRATQRRDALSADRRAVLGMLSSLSDTEIGEGAALVLPDLDAVLARSGLSTSSAPRSGSTLPAPLRMHPQFRALEAQRAGRERQVAVVEASRRPKVSAFGQVALGSPGYRQFTDDPHEYWRAGVRVQWSPWEWNRSDRDVEQLRLEQRLIDTREEAFTERLLRALETPLERIRHLEATLLTDDRIIALREQVEAQARVQLAERVISASAYADARSDVQEARIARLRHQTERVRAQAQYLITLGLELGSP